MYVILMYDIAMDEKGAYVQRNVFKLCKQFLTHVQFSVFEGELTQAQLMSLQLQVKRFIRSETDSLLVFKSREARWLQKEFWGKVDDATSNIL